MFIENLKKYIKIMIFSLYYTVMYNLNDKIKYKKLKHERMIELIH